LGDGVAGDLN